MLRLRPGLQIAYRSPTVLQIGAPDPVVVLEGIDHAAEIMLTRLHGGIHGDELIALGVRHGRERHEVESFLDRLTPVLAGSSTSGAQRRTVRLEGTEASWSPVLAEAFAAGGIPVRTDGVPATTREPRRRANGGRRGEVVVLASAFVVDPVRTQSLLAADVDHLAIIVGDRTIEVSPLIRPGQTACLTCEALHRTDRDECWPVVAAQLRGRRLRETDAAALTLAAHVATRAIVHPDAMRGTIIALDDATIRQSAWRPHAACGCRGLPGIDSPPVPDRVDPTQRHGSLEVVPERG